jgi:hypothetical protein
MRNAIFIFNVVFVALKSRWGGSDQGLLSSITDETGAYITDELGVNITDS